MEEVERAVEEAVNDRFEREQVPLLAALVEQPSCSREPSDVERAAAILDQRAEALGLDRELYPDLSLIHIPSPRDGLLSRMPSSA